MNIQFETWPSCRIAYIRRVGPYGAGNKQTMEDLKKWARKRMLLTPSATILGIPQDDPNTTPPERCRYDVGIVLLEDVPLDYAVEEGKLDGGKYLICQIRHTAEDIAQTWKVIYQTVEDHGYHIDNKPVIERYTMDMVDHGYCEICVPITS